MSDEIEESGFQFAISLSVLNHLGRNLYRNFITVLGEAISNSWDADANNVWIEIDRENSTFSIKDDGLGMNAEDFQGKFLKIGYSKRASGQLRTDKKRPYIGAKGIGKLALLSCAQRVSVFTKTANTDYVGGVIDNTGLDKAITDDLVPEDYPLEGLDLSLIEKLSVGHEKGTIIVFEGVNDNLRNSISHLKKLLAMSFKFSLIDKEFSIHVNGETVSITDLKDMMDSTEFLWTINGYSDEYVTKLPNLKSDITNMTTTLSVKGFLATVVKPRNLKIAGTEERATVDLFVNGRIREKNILRHIPTQRILESYIYGQIHFDVMDSKSSDPFTSSREGVKDTDENFKAMLGYLKSDVIPQILDDWDRLRLGRGEEGDEENPRKSKKQRKARDLFSATKDEYEPESDSPNKDKVEDWLAELRPDAEFNFASYADCFLSENLLRKYIADENKVLPQGALAEAQQWRDSEVLRKTQANIQFEIRQSSDDIDYLGMDALAVSAEGGKTIPGGGLTPLWGDAVAYRPVRNVVGHTGLLTQNAKAHLSLRYQNIKARVKHLISGN